MEQELRSRERVKQAKEDQSTLLGSSHSPSSIPTSSASPLLDQVCLLYIILRHFAFTRLSAPWNCLSFPVMLSTLFSFHRLSICPLFLAVCLSVLLAVCLSVLLAVCLSVLLADYPSVLFAVRPSIPFALSARLSASLSSHLSAFQSVYSCLFLDAFSHLYSICLNAVLLRLSLILRRTEYDSSPLNF